MGGAYYKFIIPPRPIGDSWPGKRRTAAERMHSRFKAKYSDTDDLLNRELGAIGATDVVMHLDVRERDIRRDGELRANARPDSPAVLLAFNHPKLGALAYPCDTYHDHKDNIRAIAKALEALRMVDRYGVTRNGEQYAGWRKLPPGSGRTEGGMTLDDAFDMLAKLSGLPRKLLCDNREVYAAARLKGVWKVHPDQGGSTQAYQKFNVACELIQKHFDEG